MHGRPDTGARGLDFLAAGGEMAALTRAPDWSATALGPVEAWPQSLRTTVALMLVSPGPASVLWGPDRVQLYNDAYIPIAAERHPAALGMPASTTWAEAFAGFLGPIFDRVFAGEAVDVDEHSVSLRKPAGGFEDRFFTGSFLPVRDETGGIGGVFHPLTEVTARVRADASLRESEARHRFRVELSDALRGLTSPTEIMAAVAERLGPHLRVDQVNFYLVEADSFVVADEWQTASSPGILGSHPLADFGEDAVARLREGEVLRLDNARGAQGAEAYAAAGMVAVLSVPLHRDGRWAAGLHLHQARPRTWTDEEVALVEQVAARTWAEMERARAEAELRGSEARYRTLFETIDEGFCVVEFIDGPHGPSSDYVHLEANPAYARHAGIPHIVGKTGRSTMTEAEADGWIEVFRQVLETGEPLRFERALEATSRHLEVASFPVRATDRRQRAILFQDVTARTQAEERLRELNETLEQQVTERTAERDRMWETSPDLMLVIDFEGIFCRVNPAWTTLLGYEPHELIGHHVNEFVVPDDHAGTVDAYELAAAGGQPAIENRYRHKDGSVRWISWVAAPAGGVTYATGRDITAEKERAAELRRYRDIVEATAAPLCAFDTDFRLIAFNKAHNDEFRRVNGFDTKIGDVFPDLFVPEQGAVMRAHMTRALSGESFTVVAAFGRPDLGTPAWEISYTPLRDEAGRIIGAFHHAEDISKRLVAEAELETAQEALRQTQKMEAMGQLTGGVAHDFNNLLTPIIGSLDMLTRRGVGSERERRLIDGALQSAERAKTLVQRLLAFARRQPLQPVAVDLAALVESMAGLMSSTIGPRIEVRVEIEPGLPPAVADPNQLEMALLNLAVNARDAMPDSGALTIRASRGSVRGERSGLRPGHYVRLSVADTGNGMDEATRARAVEPFFSTKGIGKGTGLGLSMVHGLTAQLGGGLTIASAPGQGTTVELWLPASLRPAEADGTGASAPQQPRSTRGWALLVDDEDLVRMSTADMLMDLGYEVAEACSAEEALRLLDGGLAPDLLVTDHLMPGMSGAELARQVRSRSPDLPVLIVSGYAQVDGIAPDLPRLTKPFRNAELAQSLAALMAADRG